MAGNAPPGAYWLWPSDALIVEPRLAHRRRIPGIAQIDQNAAAHRLPQPHRRERAKFVPLGDQHHGVRARRRVQGIAAPGHRFRQQRARLVGALGVERADFRAIADQP